MTDMRCCAIIDLDSAAKNYRYIRTSISKHTKIMCVVKANAYGHGAVRMAKHFEQLGADMCAVATAEEAIELREHGVLLPCLVLGYAPHTFARLFLSNNIFPTIYSLEDALQWEETAQQCISPLSCHLKINTGMNRLGIPHDDIPLLKRILSMPHLSIVGIYSHFAAADVSPDATEKQLQHFLRAATIAEGICGRVLIRHIANTEALLRFPRTHLDLVRAGIGLYGYCTTDAPLLPVMRLTARIIQIHTLFRGDYIGYGRDHKAKRDMRVAILSIGYADGIRRDSALHGVRVSIRCVPCRIVGRVCMDMCMVDVSHCPNAAPGDEAHLFGDEPKHGADALSQCFQTNPYEVLTSVSDRARRVYLS